MSRPLWFVSLLRSTFGSRFLLARLTRVPLIRGLVDRALFEGDDLFYLPRETRIPVDQPLSRSEEMVLPSQVVTSFVERARYHWIMDTCICRVSSHCQDYPLDLGCLFLGEAVLNINPKLGHLATVEEALDHVRRCREAGLVHLVGRNKLDTVWLGVAPGHKLLTICNCCPCCCLWRILPDLDPSIGAKVGRMPTVEVRVTARCVGCGHCTEGVCFAGAIRLEGGRAVVGDACRGCGRCVDVCPQGAIELTYDPGAFKTAVDRLRSLVDVS